MSKVVTNQEDIIKIIRKYALIFPNCKMTVDSMVLYSELLQDCELEKIEKAFRQVVSKSKYFPMVAEIREIASIKEPVFVGTPEYEAQQKKEQDEFERQMQYLRSIGALDKDNG